MTRYGFAAVALTLFACAELPAQTFQLGAVYQCPGAQSFKVLSCAGSANADLCDVQSYSGGQPNMRGKSTHQQVVAILQICHLQTPQEAQAEARGGAGAAPGGPPQAGPNGFKVGDTVQINTAFGWMDAQILAINGNNSYRVHAQSGADVNKPYPTELRRIGPLTARDRAAGIYNLHDRVQANFNGTWLDGEIISSLNMEYEVKLPGNRSAWFSTQNLRFVGEELKPVIKTGVPPKPGFTACPAKFDGRWTTTGAMGSMTFTFRAGKTTVRDPLDINTEFECWISGDQIILHHPADANYDMQVDLNNDGTLQTPFGEIKKKGN
jgi:hypothetical protein